MHKSVSSGLHKKMFNKFHSRIDTGRTSMYNVLNKFRGTFS